MAQRDDEDDRLERCGCGWRAFRVCLDTRELGVSLSTSCQWREGPVLQVLRQAAQQWGGRRKLVTSNSGGCDMRVNPKSARLSRQCTEVSDSKT